MPQENDSATSTDRTDSHRRASFTFFSNYLLGSHDPIRPYVLLRGLLLLLAFDCWIELVPHAGRYGAGGFNVAHFEWLDAVAPLPTPALYIGVQCLCGLIALGMACTRPHRALMALLAGLYTYGWTMSMLDSYQHHYLLSLVLLCGIFFPMTPAEQVLAARSSVSNAAAARQTEAHETRASFAVLGLTFSIVYVFAAIHKLEPQWWQGDALMRLGRSSEAVMALEQWWLSAGFDRTQLWRLLGKATVFGQLLIASGYAAAPLLHRTESLNRTGGAGRIWLKLMFGFKLMFGAAAILFHAGTELLDLNIGWFSYYMMLCAASYFFPASMLSWIASTCTVPARFIAHKIAERSQPHKPDDSFEITIFAILVAIVSAALGASIDLPGAFTAGLLVAGTLIGVVMLTLFTRKLARRAAMAWIAGSALSMAFMWIALTQTTVRFDFYRFVGGDHRRRGEPHAALAAYIKANRYAPEEDNRVRQEQEMRALVRGTHPPR